MTIPAAALTLILGATALAPQAAAFAAPAATPDTETASGAGIEFTLEGRLGVLASEPLAGGGETPASVLLATNEGPVIRLDASTLADAGASGAIATGDEFAGTVLVSEDVAARLEASGQESSAPTTDAASDGPSDAVVLDATVTPRADKVEKSSGDARSLSALTTPRAHTLDIAVLAGPGDGAAFGDTASIGALVANVNSYWVEQSGGAVSSFTQNGAARRIAAVDVCSPEMIWEQASAAFGRTASSYWESPNGARHLLAVTSTACGGSLGLGTVGYTPHEGGLLWAVLDSERGASNVIHELGHNLGLGHSSQHWCSTNTTLASPVFVPGSDWWVPAYDNSACTDYPYEDFYDPMAGGLAVDCPGAQCANNGQVEALNAAHKSLLGFWRTGESQLLNITPNKRTSTTTVTLKGAGTNSGLRVAQIVDPRTGEVFIVEYRNGAGRDSGAFYTRAGVGGGLGVRVLRISQFGERPEMLGGRMVGADSLAVDPKGASWTGGNFLLDSGETFSSLRDAVQLSVVSSTADEATLKVTFNGPPVVERVSGPDRFATSVALSKSAFPGTAPIVYIATGMNFPDALAAAPAATKNGGPLLLTPPSSLPQAVSDEVKRLKPARIVVVGSDAVVSAAVFDQLRAIQPNTERIFGADRYETAARLVSDAFPNGADRSWLVTGTNFPDALSAAAAAGAAGIPVSLVYGPRPAIDTETSTLLRSLKVKEVLVAGSAVAVSEGIVASIPAATGASASRFFGADRFDTSYSVSKSAFTNPKTVYLASGHGFPDALAGAAVAGANNAPLFVVRPWCVPGNVLDQIDKWNPDRIVVIGGTPALNEDVAKLKRC